MEERATGIILRTRLLTETSIIAQWLTAEHGRVATVAKGARRPKSPYRGKLDLFYKAEFTYARSRRSELHTLKEMNVLDTHPKLREELGYVQQASYAAALLEQTTETDTPLASLYTLFSEFIAYLPMGPPQPKSVFALELKILEDLGLTPDPAKAAVSPGARQIMTRLAHDSWVAIANLKLTPVQEMELGQHLHGFLIYHLGKFPHSRAAALHPN
jgi:DNA repair protein RecO (recombination protein O)